MNIDIFATGSTGNCYRISDGKSSILLECGIAYNKILKCLNYNLSSIQGVLISHSHNDHAYSFEEILRSGTDVYLSKETSLDKIASSKPGIEEYDYFIHLIEHKKKFMIGTLEIIPLEVVHDAYCLSFYIHSKVTDEYLYFATDTNDIPYNFDKIDYLMVEANYSLQKIKESVELGYIPDVVMTRIMKSHMEIGTLKNWMMNLSCDITKIKTIYLIHGSKNNSNKEYFKDEIAKLTGTKVIYAEGVI